MDFIEEVQQSTSEFESPKRFYYWSALAAVSAVLKDKVSFDMGGNYELHPNIYVLLYGPSGIRKGPPIALAEDLVSRVDNTRIIDGRSSIEAILKELGTVVTRPGKELIKDSCCFLVSSELSSSIVGNTAALDIMTNLYDRKYNVKEWKYRLKNSESACLNKPTITWLSGTNEALFRDFIPEKNINGGLLGRTFIISETKKAVTNSLMFKTRAPDKPALANQLKLISKLKGEYKMADDVRKGLDLWYNKFDTEVAPTLNDETGFVSRVFDFVIVISMIIAAGRRAELEIKLSDTLEASNVVLNLVAPSKNVANQIRNKTDQSEVFKRGLVLRYLVNRTDCRDSRIKILQNLGLQISGEDLDKIVGLFMDMQIISSDHEAGQVYYRLRTDRPQVQEFLKNYRS